MLNKHLLIVEDEPDMQQGIKDNLEFEGYTVDVADDGEMALKKITNGEFDLILLDVMIPKISGFDVCKQIRHRGIETPIIFLTAKGEEIDKVIGLESGGDDYMTKPFSLRELMARIKAVLRRTGNSNQPEVETLVTIGKLEVNFDNYLAVSDGQPVKLTAKEFEILRYLLDHKNSTISRDSILDSIWGYDYQPTARTVDNFILKLRQKIETDPNHPEILITVHGIGYRFVY
ncbi:response regulator transcription factor [Carboxylicivirga linearis]|uniref:Response regulator transcription factor n=1 Tax=Carboxylicivirga linearis TaxID=1628157 RepID=A0ABS5JWM3_9BACT|nr:response regulator transcription factor [Carboxylicivirga linearis]MBS2099229.1 response regulator transcription factor [Carboxylicivirga linearis]